MVFSMYFRKYWEFRKIFQIKVVDLIEMHILCCINFYFTGDSFPEKDRQSLEVVIGWGTIRVGVFFDVQTGTQPQWKKPLPLLPKPVFFLTFQTETHPNERRHPSPSTEAPVFSLFPEHIPMKEGTASPCTEIPVFSRVPNTSFLENLIFLGKKWIQRKTVLNTKDVFFYALQCLFEIFFEIPIIYENNWKKPRFYGFFMGFVIEFKFALIFTMIFVISTSKYVIIRSSQGIGGQSYSELYPSFLP